MLSITKISAICLLLALSAKKKSELNMNAGMAELREKAMEGSENNYKIQLG